MTKHIFSLFAVLFITASVASLLKATMVPKGTMKNMPCERPPYGDPE